MSDSSGQANETTIRLRVAISNAYAMVSQLPSLELGQKE